MQLHASLLLDLLDMTLVYLVGCNDNYSLHSHEEHEGRTWLVGHSKHCDRWLQAGSIIGIRWAASVHDGVDS